VNYTLLIFITAHNIANLISSMIKTNLKANIKHMFSFYGTHWIRFTDLTHSVLNIIRQNINDEYHPFFVVFIIWKNTCPYQGRHIFCLKDKFGSNMTVKRFLIGILSLYVYANVCIYVLGNTYCILNKCIVFQFRHFFLLILKYLSYDIYHISIHQTSYILHLWYWFVL